MNIYIYVVAIVLLGLLFWDNSVKAKITEVSTEGYTSSVLTHERPKRNTHLLDYRYAYRNTPDSYGWYPKTSLWSLVGTVSTVETIDNTDTQRELLNLYRRPNRFYRGYWEYRVETPHSNIYLNPHIYKVLKNNDAIHIEELNTGLWRVSLNEF